MDFPTFARDLESRHLCIVAAAELRGLYNIAAAADRVWLFHLAALEALERALEESYAPVAPWSPHA